MHTKDGNIVHQCLSGNTELFALLVDKYKERIFALVYAKVGQFQDAEDITQDVFLEAYRKLSTLRRWDSFYPWLYSIASNQCKNYHYDRKRRVDMTLFDDPADIHQADMDAHTEKLRNEQIREALDSLSEIHRQVLVLRYMAGMRSKEIARTLRVSPNTVNQRLMRARTQLKAVLNEEAITMIPTAFAERKLHPGFTARITELIKGTQIQSAPHKTALPLGLSAAGGVIILLLSLSIPQSPLYPVGEWLAGPLPLKTQAFENGELTVDAEATQVAILGGEQEDGSFGQEPKRREIFAAVGEPEDSPKPEQTRTRLHVLDDFPPSWDLDFSPDGRRVVYYSIGRPDITIPPGLVVRSVVSVSPDVDNEPTVLLDEDFVHYFQPKWSPDGKWIAFHRHTPATNGTSPGSGEDMEVCLIPASGGDVRFLARTGSNRDPDGLSWSPDSKQLAFVKWQGENADISIVSIATGEVRAFTTDGKENIKPTWSGDGKWITYMSKRGGWFSSHRRWIQALDGRKPRILEGSDGDPHLSSPDGKWLVYLRRKPDRPHGFYASRVNSRGESSEDPVLLKATISNLYGKPIKWTSDGQIIMLEPDLSEKTYALSIKNGEKRLVSETPGLLSQHEHTQWSSDGSILFLSSRHGRSPSFIDIDKGLLTPLPIVLPKGMQFADSSISPDGQRIAFVQFKMETPTDGLSTELPLPEVNAHLHIAQTESGISKYTTRATSYLLNPRWSPDGQEIAFINTGIREQGIVESELCVMSVTTNEVRTLVDSELYMNPAWSPDGTRIAYLRMKNKGKIFDPDETEGDLYVIPATGGTPKRITNTPEYELTVAWTPDGKRLTFEINGEMWIASVDGGGPRKLKRGYIPSSWSSDGQSYFAFGYSGELVRVFLDGTTTLELPSSVAIDAHPISMSPDGKTILYKQNDSGTQCWMLDASHLVSQ